MTLNRFLGRELAAQCYRQQPDAVFGAEQFLMAYETLVTTWEAHTACNLRMVRLPYRVPKRFRPILEAYARMVHVDFSTLPALPDEPFVKGQGKSCLLYSGGAESHLLAAGTPELNVKDFDILTIEGVDDRSDCGVEAPAVIAAWLLGYDTIILGEELNFEIVSDCPFDNADFRGVVGRALGVELLAPIEEGRYTKTWVLSKLHDLGLWSKIVPCFQMEAAKYNHTVAQAQIKNIAASGHSHYCGNCSKCWITWHEMYGVLLEKYPHSTAHHLMVPFQLTVGCTVRQRDNLLRFVSATPPSVALSDMGYSGLVSAARFSTDPQIQEALSQLSQALEMSPDDEEGEPMTYPITLDRYLKMKGRDQK